MGKIKMKKTYWNGRGTHSALANELEKLIPIEGQVENPRKNPKLEKFRKARNTYVEIFNNGCINTTRGAALLGMNGRDLRAWCRGRNWGQIHEHTEPAMDQIILDAAEEQGLTPR